MDVLEFLVLLMPKVCGEWTKTGMMSLYIPLVSEVRRKGESNCEKVSTLLLTKWAVEILGWGKQNFRRYWNIREQAGEKALHLF